MRSKALSEFTKREASNHGKNGKKNSQFNTLNPSTPKVSIRLQTPFFPVFRD
jgi:hypothetical protein